MSGRTGGAVFINSRRLGEFEFTPEHPFKPERTRLVYELCMRRGLFSAPDVRVEQVETPEEGVLERFHTPEYIALLKKADIGAEIEVDTLYHGIGTMENPVFRGLYEFAALSSTASLVAARTVADEGGAAFNPCGGFHHAHRDRASGFCYVNDIAIAIGELLQRGLRVAYVDIDAHHGDGVQEAFYEDDRVLTISIHETGKTLFPWGGFEREKGRGAGEGYNINVPLLAGADDEIFLQLFSSIAVPAIEAFSPDVVVGQFGTDTFAGDPLTHLRMTNNGYVKAVKMLRRACPSIVALGGGGYNMDSVVRGWTLLWAVLSGQTLDEGYGGALGGVFLGDSEIDGGDLRDMRVNTTGPQKEELRSEADRLTGWFEKEILPVIS
ncbi:MAG TPA: acetoin utilization protein AcuC [Candidatus Krumholzibacterium sp.]|nr:acetoin utilization protein AcuC [Candidatus Krumholzibacterium sp.]